MAVAKLAFDVSDKGILKTFVRGKFPTDSGQVSMLWSLRIFFGALAILMNAFMLKYFIASLTLNGATKATIYTFSCNFILTVF